MNETTFLGDTHRDQVWRSTLSGALYRWDERIGWESQVTLGGVSEYRPVKAGVVSTRWYAHAGEKFTEVNDDPS